MKLKTYKTSIKKQRTKIKKNKVRGTWSICEIQRTIWSEWISWD